MWLPDNLFLLQELLPHDPEQGIVRMEFLGGELLYAMRVISHGCSTCVRRRSAIRQKGAEPARSRRQQVAAPPVEFHPFLEVPREAVDVSDAIVAGGAA